MGDYSQDLHINYLANRDFTGTRQVKDSQELVEFRDNSLHRIWINDLSAAYDTHWHSAMEVIIPLENYYEAIINGTTYRVEPDEILIIPPRELHSLIAPPTGVRIVYLMDISSIVKLRSFAGIRPILSQPLHLTRTTFPLIFTDIYDIFFKIRSEYFNQTEFAELIIQSLLLDLFVKLGENRANENNLLTNVKPTNQHKYIKCFNAALEYIEENYNKELYLEDLAAKCDFSKYHFSRLFKQYTGYSFSDYLCNRRVRAAEELLGDSGASITDIALESGFLSISTFNRIFKEKKGMTPSEYRRHHHNSDPSFSNHPG